MLINPKITLQKSYLSFEINNRELSTDNIIFVQEIIERLEENNIVITPILFENLLRLSYSDLKRIHVNIMKKYEAIEGIFLYSTFAINESLKKEKKIQRKNLDNVIKQFIVYFLRYELNMNSRLYEDYNIEEMREELLKNQNNKNTTPEVKKNISILKYKSPKDFQNDLKNTIETPIVFGNSSLLFIENAYKFATAITCVVLEEANINVKENLFVIYNLLNPEDKEKLFLLKTLTDVLRLAMLMAEEDYLNLDNNKTVKKYKYKTSHKRLILLNIEKLLLKNKNQVIEEMLIPRNKLILRRMIRNINPLARKYSKFPLTQKTLHSIFIKNKKIETFNSKLENYRKAKDVYSLINLLVKKPGLLLRNLDFIARNANTDNFSLLLTSLKEIKDPNIKLIMQLNKYISTRSTKQVERIINVKGSLSISDKILEPLSLSKIEKLKEVFNLIIMNKLKGKSIFSEKQKFKSVYLDETLKGYVLPTELRNTSVYKNGNILTPGTRIKIPESKFLRLYTAWGLKDNLPVKELPYEDEDDHYTSTYDLDLSIAMITEDNIIKTIGWNASKGNNYASFSGDIVDCISWDKNDISAEFIDVDTKLAYKKGIRYIISSNIIFSPGCYANDFNTNLKAVCGIMPINERVVDRNENRIAIKDELFEMELFGNYNAVIPYIFDLKTNEIIIVDKYLRNGQGSSIQSYYSNVDILRKNYTEALTYKENMYDFLTNYFTSNGFNIIKNIPKNLEKEDKKDILYVSSEDRKDFEVYNVSKELDSILQLLS